MSVAWFQQKLSPAELTTETEIQSEILLVTIKKLSKRVCTNFKANSFSTPCIT